VSYSSGVARPLFVISAVYHIGLRDNIAEGSARRVSRSNARRDDEYEGPWKGWRKMQLLTWLRSAWSARSPQGDVLIVVALKPAA
jgi:hypothetical protein